MLVSLSVRNFAIIDFIQLDFHPGMSVLTGETGAGKSLIIDAIGLLFGKKADSELIRFGEIKATIEGVFSSQDNDLRDYLKQLGMETEEEIIIKRELYASGKSICRVNNVAVTLAQLQDISEFLGDIHSQNDTIGLVNPKNYLKFIQNDQIEKEVILYQSLLKEYRKKLAAYHDLIQKEIESKEKEDFLRFQFKELTLLNLSVEEEENLKQEILYWSNAELIAENMKEFHQHLEDSQVFDHLYDAINALAKISKYDLTYETIKKGIEEHYYALEEIAKNPKLRLSNLEYDEQTINEINERLAVYSEMRRKYKKTTPELLDYFKKIKDELSLIENYDFLVKEAKEQTENFYDQTVKKALEIRQLRQNVCQSIQEKMNVHLVDLELKNVQFEITFNELPKDEIRFYPEGIDQIDFLVSFNKGEPVKSLAKVASGGEMSRFMLALKVVLGDFIKVQTKIFDEIDHGVSGAIAYSIAKKIKEISQKSQVLCITHLPQVASISNHHLKIAKKVEQNRTLTQVFTLTTEERVVELARMISKGEPTPASLLLGRELLDSK